MDALEFSGCKDVLVILAILVIRSTIREPVTDRKLFDPTTSRSKKDNTDQGPASLLREESPLEPISFPVPCNMNRSVSFNYFEINSDKGTSITGISAYPEEWFALQGTSFTFLTDLFFGLKVCRVLRLLDSMWLFSCWSRTSVKEIRDVKDEEEQDFSS